MPGRRVFVVRSEPDQQRSTADDDEGSGIWGTLLVGGLALLLVVALVGLFYLTFTG
jgi:hypothetical protein